MPSTQLVVPEGLTVVTLAAGLIPILIDVLRLDSIAIAAASFKSKSSTFPLHIPVMPIPTRASFSVVSCQIERR